MELNELFSKNEKQLKAMKKDDLVKVILDKGWYYRHDQDNLKSLCKDLELSKKPYDQAKQMLLGATGYEPPIDEYSKKAKLDDVDLCFLIGLLLSTGERK